MEIKTENFFGILISTRLVPVVLHATKKKTTQNTAWTFTFKVDVHFCVLFVLSAVSLELGMKSLKPFFSNSNSRPAMIGIVVQPFKKLFIHKRVIMRCVVKRVKFLQ
jgi:hypothetical protein